MAKNNADPNLLGCLLMLGGGFCINLSIATGFRVPIFMIVGSVAFIIGMVIDKFNYWHLCLLIISALCFAIFRDLGIILPGVIGLAGLLIASRD